VGFSENLFLIRIIAASGQVDAVAAFIASMKKSDAFAVTLARKEIQENHLIRFELTARWVGKTT
jgi:uncharacterized membrane protein